MRKERFESINLFIFPKKSKLRIKEIKGILQYAYIMGYTVGKLRPKNGMIQLIKDDVLIEFFTSTFTIAIKHDGIEIYDKKIAPSKFRGYLEEYSNKS